MRVKSKIYLTQSLLKCCLTVLFLVGITFAHAQTPFGMNGKLKVDPITKKLVSSCGKPVQLRGLSTHSLQGFDVCYRNNLPAYDALQSWGVDVVRYAMYVSEYLNGVVFTPAQWRTLLASNYVVQCENRGLYAIIDWHVLTPGNPNTNIEEAKVFWADMSTRLAAKDNVLYEICNEPNGCSWADVKSYANTIIPIIRANDPDAVILVGNPEWSSDLNSPINDPLNFTNIMYTYHFYAGTHMGRLNEFKTNSAKIPVFVSEWGTTEAFGSGSVNTSGAQEWLDYLRTAGISWCNWSFADKNESSSMLAVNSCSTKVFTNFTATGTFVKNNLNSPSDNFTQCPKPCKEPNLGADVSLCGTTGGITLNSGLTATNKTFVWKSGTTILPGTGPTLLVNTAGNYSVSVDSIGCSTTDQIVVSSTLPTPTLATGITLCNPATATLDAGITGSGYTYAWKLNNVPIGGSTKTLIVSQGGTYSVTVATTGCTSAAGSTTVASSLPLLSGTSTICTGGDASITATGTGPFDWYTSPTGGVSVFTGPTYNPTPTVNTTYYVGATGGVVSTFGPVNAGIAPWDVTDYSVADKQLLFTPSAASTLVSVDVTSKTAQSVTINVSNNTSSALIKKATVTVPAGLSTILIGTSMSANVTYRIDAVGTLGALVFRQNSAGNTQAAVYPQTIANVGTLTSNASYSLGWSLFFNVKVSKGSTCARAPFEVKLESCTGIEDEDMMMKSMRIYPNPFENGFTIQLGPNYGVAQRIEVTDIEGRIVDVKQGNAIANTTLMGEYLPNGQYFVRVISFNKVVVKPIIKLK